MASQSWDDRSFCDWYEETWEISSEEVHYGWLAPGERSLKLLADLELGGSKVLDVGCGMAHNLVVLARQGASAYGLDISQCMLDKARRVIEDAQVENKVKLEKADMRNFSCFGNVEFDLVLSIYSMEYLSGIQELRRVFHNIYKQLRPGGIFILCFSHPSQARRYPELMNRSVPQGVGKYRTYNYSFKDATEALYKASFSLQRIVEQRTDNPSKITMKQGKLYPYHFRGGCNPCDERYDEFSNGAPHTVIYKAIKPHDPLRGLPRIKSPNLDYREIWGFKRRIVKREAVSYLGLRFQAVFLAAMDNVIGLLDVLNISVTHDDLATEDNGLLVKAINSEDLVAISANSVLGIIHRKLSGLSLTAVYYVRSVHAPDDDRIETRIFIESVLGLDEKIRQLFGTNKIGLLCFVNSEEPSKGELPLDVINSKAGDCLQLTYVAIKDDKDQESQLRLPLTE